MDVVPHFFSQSASFCSGAFASSRKSALSRSKKTSSSGRSAFSWSSVFCAKICSSVSGRGAGAGAGAGGGGGGGGGAGAAAGGGGGGGAGAGGAFLAQAAHKASNTANAIVGTSRRSIVTPWLRHRVQS